MRIFKNFKEIFPARVANDPTVVPRQVCMWQEVKFCITCRPSGGVRVWTVCKLREGYEGVKVVREWEGRSARTGMVGSNPAESQLTRKWQP